MGSECCTKKPEEAEFDYKDYKEENKKYTESTAVKPKYVDLPKRK